MEDQITFFIYVDVKNWKLFKYLADDDVQCCTGDIENYVCSAKFVLRCFEMLKFSEQCPWSELSREILCIRG